MKHTFKRTLALLIALILAIPSFALAETDGDIALEAGIAIDDLSSDDLFLSEDESTGGGDAVPEAADGLLLVDPDDLPEDALIVDGAPQSASVNYCFIVDYCLYAEQAAKEGEEITRPADPAAPEGMAFEGWFLDPEDDDTRLFEDGDALIAHPDPLCPEVNVYARFENEGTGSREQGTGDEGTGDEGTGSREQGTGIAGDGETDTDDQQLQKPSDSQKPSPSGAAEGLAERSGGPQGGSEEVVFPDDQPSAEDGDTADESTDDPANDQIPSPQGEAIDGDQQGGDDQPEPSQPITVTLSVTPETATITVYAVKSDTVQGDAILPEGASSAEDEVIAAPIPAESGNTWSLLPGEYTYSASAEGYISIKNIPFTVEESGEPLALALALEEASLSEGGGAKGRREYRHPQPSPSGEGGP